MRKLGLLFALLFLVCIDVTSADKFVVVIDPGHGGRDVGAVRGSAKEKEINLKVALALGKMIENNYSDVKVVYTRKTDVFVGLLKRSATANKAKANLFISIHTNSTGKKSEAVTGTETYILGLAREAENLEVAKRENSVILLEDNYKQKYEGFDPKSPESYIIFEFMTNKNLDQSLLFASYIQKDFKKIANRRNRGVHQAGFLVLRKTACPSVLIELGFVNNPADAKYLTSSSGQNALAKSIYSGFRKYKREFDKKQGNQKIKALQQDSTEEQLVASDIDIGEDVLDTATSTVVDSEYVTPREIQKDKIEFRVQFLTHPTKLPRNSSRFKGLSPVDYYIEKQVYKYTYGSTTDFNQAIRDQRAVSAKFKDAFIVQFKNGNRMR